MSKYSKFIGSIIGSLVGALLMFAAAKGFGTCDAVTGACSLFGMSSDVITGAVLAVLGAVGVYVAPANAPAATTTTTEASTPPKA